MSFMTPRTGPPFERKRASEACQSCRIRKIRCDVLTRPPCIRCRLEGSVCILSKQKHRRVGTVAGQVQRTGTSFRPVPLPAHDEQLIFGEEAINVSSLWPEETPPSPTGASGMAVSLPEDGPSIAGFADKPFDQADFGSLPGLDLLSPFPYIHNQTSDSALPLPQLASVLGDLPTTKPCKQSHLSNDDLDYLVKKGVFILPPSEAQGNFLKAYFLFIHPFLPIIPEDESWFEYEHDLNRTSLVLYWSMLFAACPFVSPDVVLQLGYSTVAEAQESLFEKAKLLYHFETESDETTLVSAALLLSYRSPRAGQVSVQRPTYWLSIATSMTKELVHKCETRNSESVDSGKLIKRLQWACAVRELVIALSSRNITEVKPCLPELPLLGVDEIKDATLESKVYDGDTKLLFASMFLSLTDFARLAAKIRLSKSTEGTRPDTQYQSTDKTVDCLFDVEKASLELAAWRDKFADRFSLATTTSTFANLKMLIFHRNLALLLCDSFLITLNRPRQAYFNNSPHWSEGMIELLKAQWQRATFAATDMTKLMTEVRNLGLGPYLPISMSPIAVNSGIVHILQQPLYGFAEASDRPENVKLCIDVLEEMQQRFPVVNDMITMLYATIQFAEQEVAAYSLDSPLKPGFRCGKDLLSGSDQEMIVREAVIISKTSHFLDGLFYKAYHKT